MWYNAKVKSRSEELVAFAAKLYGERGSGNYVAERLGLSNSTAYRLLRKSGLALPQSGSKESKDKRKKLSDLLASLAAEDYAVGMPMCKLTQKYEVGRWAIITAVRDHRIPERSRGGQPQKISDSQCDEIVRLYAESNFSQEQIAAKFKKHQTTISNVLRSRGVRRAHGPNWCGGQTIRDGYVMVWVDSSDRMISMANRQGYIMEHRLVMARRLGRVLSSYETVHHINGKREDNRIENLQLRHGKHGKGIVYSCEDCGSANIISRELS